MTEWIAWEETWWNHITGPRQVVMGVVEALLNKKNVCLKRPRDLPWRHQMRSTIWQEFKLKAETQELMLETIDVQDECANCTDIGRYLLRKFAFGAVARGFREGGSETIQDYMLRCRVLQNRIIWLKGGHDMRPWLEFCKGYAANEIDAGLFILECGQTFPEVKLRNFKTVDYMQNVNIYHLQTFNSMILDSGCSNYPELWKKYIASLAALLCETDAEVAEKFIRTMDFMHEDPIDGLLRLTEMTAFQQRGTEDATTHVLYLSRTKQYDLLQKRIWEAQIQVAFPIIELERVQFIRDWEPEIAKALQDNQIEQYGRIIQSPIELELGTLSYNSSHRGRDDNYILYIPDEEARERLRFLHEQRNDLAHCTCCSPQNLEILFQKH